MYMPKTRRRLRKKQSRKRRGRGGENTSTSEHSAEATIVFRTTATAEEPQMGEPVFSVSHLDENEPIYQAEPKPMKGRVLGTTYHDSDFISNVSNAIGLSRRPAVIHSDIDFDLTIFRDTCLEHITLTDTEISAFYSIFGFYHPEFHRGFETQLLAHAETYCRTRAKMIARDPNFILKYPNIVTYFLDYIFRGRYAVDIIHGFGRRVDEYLRHSDEELANDNLNYLRTPPFIRRPMEEFNSRINRTFYNSEGGRKTKRSKKRAMRGGGIITNVNTLVPNTQKYRIEFEYKRNRNYNVYDFTQDEFDNYIKPFNGLYIFVGSISTNPEYYALYVFRNVKTNTELRLLHSVYGGFELVFERRSDNSYVPYTFADFNPDTYATNISDRIYRYAPCIVRTPLYNPEDVLNASRVSRRSKPTLPIEVEREIQLNTIN